MEESKLATLKNIVASIFEAATEKEQIENLAKINNAIDEVEKEQKQLFDKNAELIKGYKELVKHTSFKEQPSVETTTPADVPSLESALAQFIAANPLEK